MEKVKPLTVEAKLVQKQQLTHDVIELYFESNPPFHFEPGQFISIFVPGAGPGGRDLRRAYSIASAPEKGMFELCVKLVEGGPGTQYLHSLKIGDSLKGMAPYGDFTYKTKHGKHVMFIATGTGIAPFRSMLLSKIFAENPPETATLLFGARKPHDLIYAEEMKSILIDRFVVTLSQPTEQWVGFKGRVTDWLRANESNIHWSETEFYLCGNGAMIDEVKQILHAHLVEKPMIHQEVYYKPKPGESHAN
jgi:CDP-4-dehydro-6-deoxyglucose reductase